MADGVTYPFIEICLSVLFFIVQAVFVAACHAVAGFMRFDALCFLCMGMVYQAGAAMVHTYAYLFFGCHDV